MQNVERKRSGKGLPCTFPGARAPRTTRRADRIVAVFSPGLKLSRGRTISCINPDPRIPGWCCFNRLARISANSFQIYSAIVTRVISRNSSSVKLLYKNDERDGYICVFSSVISHIHRAVLLDFSR